MNNKIFYTIVIVTGLFMTSCSNTRKLPVGDSLYVGAKVIIEDSSLSKKKKSALKSELSSLTRPKPNTKILGVRFKLFAYNLAGHPKKQKSPAGILKNKIGEPPVLLSEVNVDRNIKVLQSYLENKGYFRAIVTGDTIVKSKKATAQYNVLAGARYIIDTVRYDKDSSILLKTIDSLSAQSFLKTNDAFDLDIVKAERERLDNLLKEKGFYYFNPEFIKVQVDTTIGNNKVNLYVKVKPSTPKEARDVYTINDIYVFTNFRLNVSSPDTLKKYGVYYKGYYVVDRRKTYKPRLFEQSILFEPGDIYKRSEQVLTVNRLVNLGVFKYVKNRIETAPGIDSPKLNSFYYLTALPKKSLRGEVNASTKSNNLTGSSITLGWRNRNTFRGGELLAIDATGGFEVQFSGQQRGYNTFRVGLEAKLTIPRFLIPFIVTNTRGGFVPRTNLLLSYDILRKQKLYTMNSFRAGFGYAWKENAYKEHQLNPIDINYVQPLLITPLYKDSSANNPTLLKAVEKQFILGSNYNFNYNELQGDKVMSGIYFNGNFDISGNVAGLITGANVKTGNQKQILGADFSQYVKMEADFRYYAKVAPNTVWANRIITGIGVPYGNSSELPFIKQFFIGGNNSIRAFRSRSLGPGTYKDSISTTFLPDQSGDIKLEMNTELRAKVAGMLHGAIFIDAGNIWLFNKNPLKPGGEFTKDFLQQLAVGGGVGLRFDISFLVIRFDVAFPLRVPYLPDGHRWVINQINFGDAQWRKQNLVYNLGIGYPF